MRTHPLVWSGLVSALLGGGCGGGGGGTPAAPAASNTAQAVTFATGQSAAVVLGQPGFTVGAPNQGGAASAVTVNRPYGSPATLNGILYLPDYSNNRVLGFNAIPASNDAPADFVLGQVSFTSTGVGTNMYQMSEAQTAVTYDGALFIDEFGNNRIDVYSVAPTSAVSEPAAASPMPISFTLTASQAGIGGLYSVESISVGGGHLVATDSGHNRVLIWNTVPTTDVAPSLVLGQTNFTGVQGNQGLAAPTASTLSYPAGVWTDGQRLVVLDSNNNRVLIWNTFPTANDQPADVVLGQPGFTVNAVNQGLGATAPTGATLSYPYDGVWSNGLQLFVTDNGNNRTLIWNTFPAGNDQPADVVLGQAGFGTATGATTATGEATPTGLLLIGKQLVVADKGNNRYLIYNGQ